VATHDALVLLSGGIDSTTVLVELTGSGRNVISVTFNYGQTLSIELEYARDNAVRYGVQKHMEVPLDLSAMGVGCSLIDRNVELHLDRNKLDIDDDPHPTSYVPFRNGIFLAWLVALGECMNVENIYAGCNEQSGGYPDDTRQFIAAMSRAADLGTSPGYHPMIFAPFTNMAK
jgi:7-cyano-7-deazaguanine synthase